MAPSDALPALPVADCIEVIRAPGQPMPRVLVNGSELPFLLVGDVVTAISPSAVPHVTISVPARVVLTRDEFLAGAEVQVVGAEPVGAEST